MRQVVALVVVCACWAVCGCAPGMFRPKGMVPKQMWRSDSVAASARRPAAPRSDSPPLEQNAAAPAFEQFEQDFAQTEAETDTLFEEQELAPLSDVSSDEGPPERGTPEQGTPEQGTVNPAAYAEQVDSPQPKLDSVTRAADISDPDALTRTVSQVSVDIRPPQGELPTDLAAAAFAASAEADEELAHAGRPETSVSWTPWTLCYRPLYFEEVALERYGSTVGCIQPGVSAVHFFFGVGLLPYKIVSRFPTSCQCSNGFARCGDAPPPGYIDNQIHPDAAVIEAALLAGIVLALP